MFLELGDKTQRGKERFPFFCIARCLIRLMYLVAVIPHVQSTLVCPVVDSLQALFGTRYFKRSLDENRGSPLLFSQPRYSTSTLPFLWRLFIQIKRWKGLETLLSLLAILPRLLYAAPPPPPPLPPLPTLKRLLRRTCRKCGNLSLGSILRSSKKKFCKAWRNFETSVSHGFQSHLTFDEMGSHF